MCRISCSVKGYKKGSKHLVSSSLCVWGEGGGERWRSKGEGKGRPRDTTTRGSRKNGGTDHKINTKGEAATKKTAQPKPATKEKPSQTRTAPSPRSNQQTKEKLRYTCTRATRPGSGLQRSPHHTPEYTKTNTRRRLPSDERTPSK